MFWKPAMRKLFEEVHSLGHELDGFNPAPPELLPNDADFSTEAKCRKCSAFLHILWSPFDDEGLTAHGAAIEDRCTGLRQPAAFKEQHNGYSTTINATSA
jgi:hypothetical protein